MTILKAFIKKHPAPAYFALTFAISWGSVIILAFPHGIPTTSEQFEALWTILVLPYFLGPSIAGLLMTGLVHGRAGFRELISRLFNWRVSARWYAAALLTTPLLVAPILLAFSLVFPGFLPGLFTATDKISIILAGVVTGLMFGGIMEELGWTGFAVPTLRRRYGVVTTGLIVGVLWGVWHFPPKILISRALGLAPYLVVDLFTAVVGLTAWRVLLVWVYDRTGSLLVAMLMHASLTASSLFILSPSATGAPLLIYNLAAAAAAWMVVAAVAAVYRRQLSYGPPGKNQGDMLAQTAADSKNRIRQPTWQRIILLIVLGYESAGALAGGILLLIAPDGRLMDMPVEILHGVFHDFLIPGMILTALGILNTAAFVAVLRRSRIDWLLAGLALGGLIIWFAVEIIILRELHWLHAMWGLPVLAGFLAALPLVPRRKTPIYRGG